MINYDVSEEFAKSLDAFTESVREELKSQILKNIEQGFKKDIEQLAILLTQHSSVLKNKSEVYALIDIARAAKELKVLIQHYNEKYPELNEWL